MAHTFTVTMLDNEVECEGMTFIINVSQHIHGGINLEIPGGFGEDDEGDWQEVDGNYHIRRLEESADFIERDDQEFEITITDEDVQKANQYLT